MANGEDNLRRLRTVIVLGTLGSSAFLSAQGSAQLAAWVVFDGMLAQQQAPAPVASTGPVEAARRPERFAAPVLERNIFDHAQGSVTWDVPPPPVAEEAESEVETPAPVDTSDLNAPHPACEGSLRLVGAYVRRGEDEQSFASIIGAAGTSLLYRVGMSLDSREVVGIGRHRVVMRQNGHLCDLNMFGQAGGGTVDPGATTPPQLTQAPPADTSPETADLEANIHQVSETSYTVNRTLVDRLLGNQAALMSAARVIPHEEEGRTVGMKVYGIRRSSLLGRLGLQNGDMLRTINGYDLADPNAILEAYTRLRGADHLSVSVVRRGTPMTMEYQVQ